MSELQLIADEDGVAVIGDPADVELFLRSEGLTGKELNPRGAARGFGLAGGALQAAAGISANSGRWIKLTEESARAMKNVGLVTSKDGVVHAILGHAGKGGFKGTLQVVQGAGTVANPAALAALGAFMNQAALQQSMEEMTEYLQAIDAKVDDILARQKDAVVAQMLGSGLVIDDALVVRETVGRVSDVTWSKVAQANKPLADVQAYALRQIETLGDRLAKGSVKDLYRTTAEMQGEIREWLAVVARCVQLQDAVHVLELDRVRETDPDEVEAHRRALRRARDQRLALIGRSTARLVERLDGAAAQGNEHVLLNPLAAPALAKAAATAADPVHELRGLLALESAGAVRDARSWKEAAGDARDDVVEGAKRGAGMAKRLGGDTLGQAKRVGTQAVDGARQMPGSLSAASRRLRRGKGNEADEAKG